MKKTFAILSLMTIFSTLSFASQTGNRPWYMGLGGAMVMRAATGQNVYVMCGKQPAQPLKFTTANVDPAIANMDTTKMPAVQLNENTEPLLYMTSLQNGGVFDVVCGPVKLPPTPPQR